MQIRATGKVDGTVSLVQRHRHLLEDRSNISPCSVEAQLPGFGLFDAICLHDDRLQDKLGKILGRTCLSRVQALPLVGASGGLGTW